MDTKGTERNFKSVGSDAACNMKYKLPPQHERRPLILVTTLNQITSFNEIILM